MALAGIGHPAGWCAARGRELRQVTTSGGHGYRATGHHGQSRVRVGVRVHRPAGGEGTADRWRSDPPPIANTLPW